MQRPIRANWDNKYRGHHIYQAFTRLPYPVASLIELVSGASNRLPRGGKFLSGNYFIEVKNAAVNFASKVYTGGRRRASPRRALFAAVGGEAPETCSVDYLEKVREFNRCFGKKGDFGNPGISCGIAISISVELVYLSLQMCRLSMSL